MTIEPLITNDTYGWLLTVYEPVYNSAGECVCYAAADISMELLTEYEISYVERTLALFLVLLVLILIIGLISAEYAMVLPINSMAEAAGTFIYDSKNEQRSTVDRTRELDIRTGDEIENLYKSVVQTTEQMVNYIDDIQRKNAQISRTRSRSPLRRLWI